MHLSPTSKLGYLSFKLQYIYHIASRAIIKSGNAGGLKGCCYPHTGLIPTCEEI